MPLIVLSLLGIAYASPVSANSINGFGTKAFNHNKGHQTVTFYVPVKGSDSDHGEFTLGTEGFTAGSYNVHYKIWGPSGKVAEGDIRQDAVNHKIENIRFYPGRTGTYKVQISFYHGAYFSGGRVNCWIY